MKAITPNDRRRLPIEVQKAVDEYFFKRAVDIDTYVFWVLRKQFGFGETRLKKFFDGYKKVLAEQEKYEDLTAEKMREALKRELGVDLELWERKMIDDNQL